MATAMELPAGGIESKIDFPCPYGLPWGAREVKPIEYPARRRAICNACEHKATCPLWRAGRCGGLLSKRTMECPEGKWGPEE